MFKIKFTYYGYFLVCRALGIPSRVITNFDSAHDTTASITVDVFVDGEGNPIKELCKDSVWNFHVWNEVRNFNREKEEPLVKNVGTNIEWPLLSWLKYHA